MRPRGTLRPTLLASVCAAALVLAACDSGSGDSADRTGDGDGRGGFLGLGGDDPEPDPVVATTSAPDQEALVIAGDSADSLSAGISAALFDSAPVVILASADEQVRAASAGVALGVPVLVDGPSTAEEIQRIARSYFDPERLAVVTVGA